MNSIFTRRSVRSFDKKQIEEEKIDKIMRAAMQAPSAANCQPWEFCVIKGEERLKKLSTFSPYSSCLAGANVGIVVLGNKERMKVPQMWEQDLGACTQNIMLEATELGLGTVWFGTAPDGEKMKFIQDMFNLTENLMPFCVIAVGYPQNDDANSFIDRFDASRIKYFVD